MNAYTFQISFSSSSCFCHSSIPYTWTSLPTPIYRTIWHNRNMFMHALDNKKKYDRIYIKVEREEQTESSLFSISILFGLNRVCFNSLRNMVVYNVWVLECVHVWSIRSLENSNNIKMLFLSENILCTWQPFFSLLLRIIEKPSGIAFLSLKIQVITWPSHRKKGEFFFVSSVFIKQNNNNKPESVRSLLFF